MAPASRHDGEPGAPALKINILGPLEVVDDDGTELPVGGPRLRAVLALLALEPDRVVPADRLIERLWGEHPPPSAAGTLQTYIAQLRRVLEPDRAARAEPRVLLTRSAGYTLSLDVVEIDVDRFERAVRDADEALATDATTALGRAEDALALWRAEPLSGDLENDAVLPEVRRLLGLRERALEVRVDALLRQGSAAAARAAAEELVREHPLREGNWARLMRAQYRDGRAVEALRSFQECRQLLAEELGVEPGPELRTLEQQILDHDPALAGPSADPDDATDAGVVVGRDRELATLREALDATGRGTGRLVLIEGPPGIGKSLLAEQIVTEAERAGRRVVWTGAVDDRGAPSLWMWERALRDLGIPMPPITVDGEDDPVAGRFRQHDAIARAVIDAARDRPSVLVLDDLQWADAGSLHVVRLLAAGIVTSALLVVATMRDTSGAPRDALDDTLGALTRERAFRRLPLAPLSADDVREYLARRDRQDLAGRADDLHRRSAGNPFFLNELVGVLERDAGAYDAGDVPTTVRAVMNRRTAALGPEARSVLALAALAGVELDVEVLACAATALGAGTDTADAVSAALSAGLLVRDGDRHTRFSHDLVRDAVVSSIDDRDRRRMHHALADAIESVHAQSIDAHLDDLARHRSSAVDEPDERAFAACSAAADLARGRLAPERAAQYRQMALDALAPDDPRRDAVRLELALDRRDAGDTTRAGADLDAVIASAVKAGDRDLTVRALTMRGAPTLWNWRAYGEVDGATIDLLRSVLHEPHAPRTRAELLGTLGVELYYGDDAGEAEDAAREAVTIASELGDPVLLGRTLNNLCIAAWRPDAEATRLAATDEALGFAGRGLPLRTEAIARMHRLSIAIRFGDVDTYEADLARCRRLARAVMIPEIEAQITYQQAGRALLYRDWDAARELADRGFSQQRRTSMWGAQWCRMIQLVTLERAIGDLGSVAAELVDLAGDDDYVPLRATAAAVLVEVGEHGDATRLLRRWGLHRLPDRHDWSSDFHLAQLGRAAAQLGIPDPRRAYDALLPLADRHVVAGTAIAVWGSTHHVLAELAARLDDVDAVAHHQHRATEADHALGLGPD